MPKMRLLKFTSCQAENADFVCQAIVAYISQRLGYPTAFVNNISWQERERLFDAGEIQVNWICGLSYIWKADQVDSPIELLAAPVMRQARYQERPVYFSDVVVHQESNFYTFADLQGASWAYNEPHSHSGYNITRYQLAHLGHLRGYFGRVVEAGAHQAALRMVLQRQVDASAIDSTVLATELQRYPELASRLRIIDTWGPSPIPPWLILKTVPQEIRRRLRDLLLQMGQDPEGRAILAMGDMAGFARVEDQDYDPIRQMSQQAALVVL